MRTIAKYLHSEMHVAWIRLLTFGIGMGLAYEVGRHVIYWLFAFAFGLAGGDAKHWGSAPPESQILTGEIWAGCLAAYLFGAFGLSIQWVQGGFMAVGKAQNVAPALLYVAGQGIARTAEMWLFPVALVVLIPFLAWQVLLFAASLAGGQDAIVKWLSRQPSSREPNSDVIDINAGRQWRTPRPTA